MNDELELVQNMAEEIEDVVAYLTLTQRIGIAKTVVTFLADRLDDDDLVDDILREASLIEEQEREADRASRPVFKTGYNCQECGENNALNFEGIGVYCPKHYEENRDGHRDPSQLALEEQIER